MHAPAVPQLEPDDSRVLNPLYPAPTLHDLGPVFLGFSLLSDSDSGST